MFELILQRQSKFQNNVEFIEDIKIIYYYRNPQ